MNQEEIITYIRENINDDMEWYIIQNIYGAEFSIMINDVLDIVKINDLDYSKDLVRRISKTFEIDESRLVKIFEALTGAFVTVVNSVPIPIDFPQIGVITIEGSFISEPESSPKCFITNIYLDNDPTQLIDLDIISDICNTISTDENEIIFGPVSFSGEFEECISKVVGDLPKDYGFFIVPRVPKFYKDQKIQLCISGV